MRTDLRPRWLLMVLLLIAPWTQAQDGLVAIPPLSARVTDLTATLAADQQAALEAELAALEQRKGAQIAVLLVPTTQPEDIAAYAIRVFDQWKLGRQNVDDGVLFIVAKDDRRSRIEVGRGLEGAIPDAAAARIQREYLTPKFRAGDFYGGIQDSTTALTRLIDGEPLPEPWVDSNDGSQQDFLGGIFGTLFALVWARVFFSGLSRPARPLVVAAAGALLGWLLAGSVLAAIGLGVFGLLIGWLGGAAGSVVRGGGSSSYSGGWGGGSSGGGGFSGGGGSSAGGGASGSW